MARDDFIKSVIEKQDLNKLQIDKNTFTKIINDLPCKVIKAQDLVNT